MNTFDFKDPTRLYWIPTCYHYFLITFQFSCSGWLENRVNEIHSPAGGSSHST